MKNLLYTLSRNSKPIYIFFEWYPGPNLDMSAICLDESGTITTDDALVYYNSKVRGDFSLNKIVPFDKNKYQNRHKWESITTPTDRNLVVWIDSNNFQCIDNTEIAIINPQQWVDEYKKIILVISEYGFEDNHYPITLSRLYAKEDLDTDKILFECKDFDHISEEVTAFAILSIVHEKGSLLVYSENQIFENGLQGVVDKLINKKTLQGLD